MIRFGAEKLLNGYTFTEDWFSHVEEVWRQLFFEHSPSAFLEIGSFEGRSTCFIIDNVADQRDIEIHCVDTWEGGVEHHDLQMSEVEKRFDDNLALACAKSRHKVDFRKDKAFSSDALARLLTNGARNHFDFVYVDGSHQAPDVLADAVISFQLLKVGGILVFDDYAWSIGDQDHYQLPKPAIDAFVNINRQKLNLLQKPLYQLYIEKTAD